MAASAERAPRRKVLVGSALPRVAPPPPLRHGAKELAALARDLGQPLWPGQERAARYLTATSPTGWLYPEVAIVAARQNGKSAILKPLIVSRLRAGQRVMHTAQDRRLPREIYGEVTTALLQHYHNEIESIRYANGQEEITLINGGRYRIVAPTRGGARGPSNDLVIIDEAREMEDFDFIAAAKPTLIASQHPQIVYLSNAGHPMSVALNALRARSGTDPSLAYLEWSAAPERAPDDPAGWCEANWAIGHNPSTLPNLEREYRANVLGGTMNVWEQEHLCRWTVAKAELLVTPEGWAVQSFTGERPEPVRPALGVKMDPNGGRVSAVLAWPTTEDRVILDVVVDVTGDPVDVDRLGPDVAALATKMRVSGVAFDPATDADLVRHLTQRSESITGRDYASATERFVRLIGARRFVVHDPGHILANDLEHTTRRVMSAGTAIAVKAGAEMTNTAAEAAIRAVWLAATPQPRPMIT